MARAVTMRDDDSVLGAPFQMVEYVPGRVVRHADELAALGGPEVISARVDALIRCWPTCAVDPDGVGLGDFGRPDGYLERQVRRWGSQWELVRLPDDPASPMCSGCIRFWRSRFRRRAGRRSCTATTASTTPSWTPRIPTIVRAVLDWEMSALGDPRCPTRR